MFYRCFKDNFVSRKTWAKRIFIELFNWQLEFSINYRLFCSFYRGCLKISLQLLLFIKLSTNMYCSVHKYINYCNIRRIIFNIYINICYLCVHEKTVVQYTKQKIQKLRVRWKFKKEFMELTEICQIYPWNFYIQKSCLHAGSEAFYGCLVSVIWKKT